jgi:hypothetical protein
LEVAHAVERKRLDLVDEGVEEQMFLTKWLGYLGKGID